VSKRVLRRCLLGTTALVLVLLGGGPALAHADLVSTEPAYGDAVPSGAGRALLRFNYPVELSGAIVELSGRTAVVGEPAYAQPDHKAVAVPFSRLEPGGHVLTWFLVARDGHVMGGELAFSVTGGAGAASAAPPSRPRSLSRFSTAEDLARLAGFASLIVLGGGVAFVSLLWPAGAGLGRTRLLLWGALTGALLATVALLGLRAAFVPLDLLARTHFWRVLLLRLGFLAMAAPVVAVLTLAPGRALRSQHWMLAAGASGLGVLVTHGLLGHAYARGPLAMIADVVHLGAVALWLGGLVVLAVVLLPRRRSDELSVVVPRWSQLAFASMATAAVAGTVLLVLIAPRWTGLAGSQYGRFLLVKLALVAALVVVASRAREFARLRLPALTVPATWAAGTGGVAVVEAPVEVSLRPFVSTVVTEVAIAASILSATAVLAGQAPPS
jgi:copper transport protein